MRLVIQRVSSASVEVESAVVGRIGVGLLVLVGVARGDTVQVAERLAAKVARLRVFPHERGHLDRSVVDVGGEALVVSQFTLLADSKRQTGARPSFSDAAPPDVAESLIEHFVRVLRSHDVHVETGKFGAHMFVDLVNDGPVTLILDA